MVNPGAVGDLAAVLCGVKVLVEVVDHAVTVHIADVVVVLVPELVLIRVVVIAALVVRERHPVQQLLELLIGDVAILGCIVVANTGRVDLQQRLRINDGEVVGTGEVQRGLVRLVGGEEREDRELVGILEQAQSLVVIFVAGRHQAFGVRVVVIDLLVLGESTVVQPPVLEQVVGLVPQFSGDFFLDLVGDGLHLLGVGGIASGLVGLSSRIGVGPHIGGTIGAIHALAGATRLREGNGVGIVTGHRPPGPVNQAVVIVVLVVVVVRLALGSE